MGNSRLVFQGLQPHCSLRGWGWEWKLSQHFPAGALSPPGPRHHSGDGRAAAFLSQSILSFSPPPLLVTILSSAQRGGCGGGGLGSEETFATFLHSFSAPPQPPSTLKKICWMGARWGGGGRGSQRESGEVMIVLWKNDQSTHTYIPFRPKQSYLERSEKAWGGVGVGEKEKKQSLVRKLQAQIWM